MTLRTEHTHWVREALESLLEGPLTDSQWQQATLDDSHGGLGLADWADIGDAAFEATIVVTSRHGDRTRDALEASGARDISVYSSALERLAQLPR